VQARTIIAEQTNRNRYWRPAPRPPQDIELTVRLEIPEGTGADVGISPSFFPSLPRAWEDALLQRLYQGVHSGLATVEAPLPPEGISIEVAELTFSPPLDIEGAGDEIRQLGDTLEALAAGTVAALWSGVNSIGIASAS
jgi:hypothetical protein